MEKREKTFLVTGSTGFLGSAIARRLLVSGYRLRLLIRKRGNHALATSFGSEGTIKEIILGSQFDEYLPGQSSVTDGQTGAVESLYDLFSNNVEIFEGDITSGGLGLAEKEYKRLCYEVDEVFHCAAATHFENQHADELVTVNVKGTENMLQFANSGKQKRFHYVSTSYVAGKQNDIVYESELVDEEPLFNNEYERSKFIAEQVVIKYAKRNEIPYTIYRPSIIVGDSKTGATCKFDNLYTFMKVLFNIRNGFVNNESENLNDITVRVPGDPDALINLVPVDYVADAIVAILKAKESINKIFHIANPDPPKLSELRDLVMPVLGIEGINVKIDGQMEHRRLSSIERLFLRHTKTYYSYLFSRLRFDCRNTQSVLEITGIVCPAITRSLVRVLVDFAISCNWGDGKQTASQKAEIAC
ncbi:MAG: Linear gramicidin synthase subunit D [Candidatus Scalindua arabica]|uniref:Linear gramicidin synthase subunit D n=1 Tax=Candidatus Scalindua arabica TaxID=1127984 RepID=A0A942A3Z8_9BACT|nr:Linear gramicidin synthase subunit D [Candidatus Scalindua arabica]